MKKIFLMIVVAIAVLLIAATVTAVSAVTVNETEFIIDDTRYEFDKKTYVDGTNTQAPADFRIVFTNYQDLADIQTVFWKPSTSDTNFVLYNESITADSYNVQFRTYLPSGNVIGSGHLTYFKGPTTERSHVRIDFNNIDTRLMINNVICVVINDEKAYNLKYVYGKTTQASQNYILASSNVNLRGITEIEYTSRFTHLISLQDYTESAFKIIMDRDGTKKGSTDGRHSDISIYDNSGNLLNIDNRSSTVSTTVAKDNQPYTLIVKSTSYGKTYTGYLGAGEPWIPPHAVEPTPTPTEPEQSAPVTVYVRNSQTGAAIANSRIVIDALVNGDYYPVVNRTDPSGIFSVTLQPTGGGMPNPDSYRLIASADGYINQMPEINFTVDEYITSIYCSLDPIAGGPLDENKTFIDFFVRDMSANPIAAATVNFGGYTMITNSVGYAVLEVNKNATYTYTVSKSGYGSLTGNVVIGADPRNTINTVLAPAVTPTKPTPIPTSTSITPIPTMTSPSGEPVSNWLEWFAAHFGMILGGGVEIGKIFMWLCFSVPVGVYVGKEAKAGAAGFMAGAGVVTLFFVLIGWVPIWLLVLLALIIGLLYAKVFNNSDNGGGR